MTKRFYILLQFHPSTTVDVDVSISDYLADEDFTKKYTPPVTTDFTVMAIAGTSVYASCTNPGVHNHTRTNLPMIIYNVNRCAKPEPLANAGTDTVSTYKNFTKLLKAPSMFKQNVSLSQLSLIAYILNNRF